jgi:pyruvate/2-oxoglutarate dehydrogenase complex dihydrolipoamide dehydrogenase (E3) component
MNDTPRVLPDDEHNRALVDNVFPPNWTNPEPKGRYNLVVIGAGTAGLVTAAGAAGLGARVALIERHLMGGDCLNYGCVPSKSIIRSSRLIGELHRAPALGIRVGAAEVDFPAVMERMRRLRAHISANDSARRFRDEKGIDVYLGAARFTDRGTIEVGGRELRYRRAVIATGARPGAPPIPGLAEAGFLTNETVFSLTQRPRRLAVIGAGPIGCELAQAFRRLGCEVSLLHDGAHILDREDADAAGIVQRVFIDEGVRLYLSSATQNVRVEGDEKVLAVKHAGGEDEIRVDEILVGAGRIPNVEGLNLESVRVRYDTKKGVHVDDYLRTTNPRIYAAGDVCMEYKFTHAADFAARIVIQNALFFGRKRLSALHIPWATYTDPEVAHVGLYERDARKRDMEVETFVRPFSEADRAIIDGEEDGFVKVLVEKGSDRIVGATIVARHAGDMIGEIGVALLGGIGLGALANVIHPYPTQAESIRQLGDAYNRTRLTPLVKKVFSAVLRLTR